MHQSQIVILMSTYNGERFINEQLKSLYEQDIDAELTIYFRDDGSNDRTLEIVNQWKNRLKIVECENSRKKQMGPAQSFWYLLQHAPDAEYYAFCDQDDIWYSNKLKRAVNAVKNSQEPVLYCANCNVIDENNKKVKQSYQEKRPILTLQSQIVCGSMQGCSMLFNRKLMKNIRKYKFQCVPMHDIVLMLNAIIDGKVIYDEVPSFGYRMHGGNVVAKGEKNLIGRIKSTCHLWFETGKKHPLSKVAEDLLINHDTKLDREDKIYLTRLKKYKKYLLTRFKIIFDKKTVSANKRGLRSFRIRIILGLI